jgi:hypothetical protein
LQEKHKASPTGAQGSKRAGGYLLPAEPYRGGGGGAAPPPSQRAVKTRKYW